MQDLVGECVRIFCEMAGDAVSSIRQVPSPFLADRSVLAEDLASLAVYSSIAARIFVEISSAARVLRPDIMHVVVMLTRDFATGMKMCGKQLLRLVSCSMDTKCMHIRWISLYLY